MEKGWGLLGRKTVSAIMLALLLIGIFYLAVNTKPVKSTWTGTVYIRADGSIDPPDAPIITYDNITYTLTDNITSSGDGIVVERDNIIIDGAGYKVEGKDSGNGVDLSYRTNITIRNMNIKHFFYGVYLYAARNNTILYNNVSYCKYVGIDIYNNAHNNIVSYNIVNQCSHAGILIGYSEGCVISYNNLIENGYGIYVGYCSKNRIYHNNLIDNAVQAYSRYATVWWDNGYPSGGNYWSDYRGTDEKSGPNQDQPGSDGIGDTPYNINSEGASAKDNYPLMTLIPEFPTNIVLLGSMILITIPLISIRRKQYRKTKS